MVPKVKSGRFSHTLNTYSCFNKFQQTYTYLNLKEKLVSLFHMEYMAVREVLSNLVAFR